MAAPNKPNDYYYAHNHLHSPAALLDDSGDVLERYEYDAYGKPYFFEPNLALSDTQASDYNNVILFTGRRVDLLEDDDLKLQYSRNRYYDYHTGRWLTHDPWGITPNVLNPDGFSLLRQYRHGLSLYHYVGSQPLKYKDPFGWYDGGYCNGDAEGGGILKRIFKWLYGPGRALVSITCEPYLCSFLFLPEEGGDWFTPSKTWRSYDVDAVAIYTVDGPEVWKIPDNCSIVFTCQEPNIFKARILCLGLFTPSVRPAEEDDEFPELPDRFDCGSY